MHGKASKMGGGGSKKKLAKEDMDFLIDNTNFSKVQIKQWYKGFMVSVLSFCSLTKKSYSTDCAVL